MKEFIKTKKYKLDMPSQPLDIVPENTKMFEPAERKTKENCNNPQNYYLIEENSPEEKVILPNQIPSNRKQTPRIPPKELNDESPTLTPLKRIHKSSLRVLVDKDLKKMDENELGKKFPQSATLPITRNLSGIIEQIRKQSNQEIQNSGIKFKKSQSNLNQPCLVCFDKAPNAVFMSCGHGGYFYKKP